MNNWCICCFFKHIFTKCTVQEAKSPAKISSDSVAWRDLILALKGKCSVSIRFCYRFCFKIKFSMYFSNFSHVTLPVAFTGRTQDARCHKSRIFIESSQVKCCFITLQLKLSYRCLCCQNHNAINFASNTFSNVNISLCQPLSKRKIQLICVNKQ
jgi:hypothetical protein